MTAEPAGPLRPGGDPGDSARGRSAGRCVPRAGRVPHVADARNADGKRTHSDSGFGRQVFRILQCVSIRRWSAECGVKD